MHKSVIISLLLFFALGHGNSQQRDLNKSLFYTVLKSGTLQQINEQLNILKASAGSEKEAYEGVLLMKKSGLSAKAKDKLNLFQSGRSKLESSILKNRNNIEYRFLRLIIQEHAPRVVKYRNELEADSKVIHTNFKSLSPFLQQQIIDYGKSSKILKLP